MFNTLKRCFFHEPIKQDPEDEYSLPRIITDHEWKHPEAINYRVTNIWGYERVPNTPTDSPGYIKASQKVPKLMFFVLVGTQPPVAPKKAKPVPMYEGFRSTRPEIRRVPVIYLPNAPWSKPAVFKSRPSHEPASLRPKDYTLRLRWQQRRTSWKKSLLDAATKLAVGAVSIAAKLFWMEDN
jgi:hypothetical protein